MLEVGPEEMEVDHDENGDAFCHIEPEKPFHRGSVNRASGNCKARSVRNSDAAGTAVPPVINVNFPRALVLLGFRHEFNRSTYSAARQR